MRVISLALLAACQSDSKPRVITPTPIYCEDVVTPVALDEARSEVAGRSARDLIDEATARFPLFVAELHQDDTLWPVSFGLGFGDTSEASLRSSSVEAEVCGPQPVMHVELNVVITGTANGTFPARVTAVGDSDVTFDVFGALDGPLAEAVIAAQEEDLRAQGFEPVETFATWGIDADAETVYVWAGTFGTHFHEDFGMSSFSALGASCTSPDPCLSVPVMVPDEVDP